MPYAETPSGGTNPNPKRTIKNEQGDLAVMSIEIFEQLNGKLELYRLLDEGRAAVKAGKKRPLADVMKDIKQDSICCRGIRLIDNFKTL